MPSTVNFMLCNAYDCQKKKKFFFGIQKLRFDISVVKSNSRYMAHWIYIHVYMYICHYVVSFVGLLLLKLFGTTWNREILGES